MSLPWFRMYGEFLTDPLIRLLSFEDQRHFIAALCMKSQGVTDKRYASVTVRRNVISSLIGLSAESSTGGLCALDQANERLSARGWVAAEGQPINGDQPQVTSDHVDRTAAERMRRYRDKRNVTPVTPVVTAVDQTQTQTQNRTDTDTDTEQSREEVPRAKRSPTASRIPSDFELTTERSEYARAQGIDPQRTFQDFTDYWKSKSGADARKHDWDATWQMWCRRQTAFKAKDSATRAPKKTRFAELTEKLEASINGN